MTAFLQTLAALWSSILLVLWGTWIATRVLTRRLERSMGQNPRWTVWEWVYSLKTHSVENLLSTMQRSETALPATHPMGSRPTIDWMDQFGFNPATIAPSASSDQAPINTRVRLGPLSPHPLELTLPVLVAPMGYGVAVTEDTRIVLAQAASLAGVGLVSGEGPYLPQERAYANRWVLQVNRGSWAHQPSVLDRADMLEIQWGQGSEAGIAVDKPLSHVPRRMQQAVPGSVVAIHAATTRDPTAWVNSLRHQFPDRPIGIKIPATDHLEWDLEQALALGVDVVTLDGSAAGSAGSPTVISDHFGLHTALATYRAHRWLVTHHVRDRISVVVSGGVHGATDIAKLLALGANAVALGSTLLYALSHEQVAPLIPSAPPTALVFAHGPQKSTARLDIDRAVEHLANWFSATQQELHLILEALGLTDIAALSPLHLIARTQEASHVFGVPWDATPKSADPAVLSHNLTALVEDYHHVNTILSDIASRMNHV